MIQWLVIATVIIMMLLISDPLKKYVSSKIKPFTRLTMSFVWFIGVLAAGDIYAYNHKIKGLVYKNGVGLLALGTAFIIFASILLQYLVTLSARLLQLKLTPILVIIYPLLIVISIGYILVALGAKKLQRIEEV